MKAAFQALKSCRLLLQEDDPAGACNRAYYAMFYAAHAALQSIGVIQLGTVYKTHSGLLSAFNKELVKASWLSDGFGSSLGKVFSTRLIADYNGDPIQNADATWAADEAEAFVAAIKAILPSLEAAHKKER